MKNAKLGYKVVGVVAGLGLGGLGMRAWLRDRTGAEELASVRRQVRAAGLPLEPSDLVQTVPPDEQNAAPLYVRLMGYRSANPLVGADKILDGGLTTPFPAPQERQQLRAALHHRQDLMQRIHQAAQPPVCTFNRNYALGANLLLPEYATMRAATRMLSAESTLLLMEGKPLESVRNQALGFHIAQHAASDPILIANLVAVAVDSITLRVLEKVLYVAGNQPGVAQAVQHAIDANWQPHSLAHGMRGEFILFTVELERARKAGPDSLKTLLQSNNATIPQRKWFGMQMPFNWEKFINANEAEVLRETQQTAQTVDRPFWEAYPMQKALEAHLEIITKDGNLALVGVLMPVYVQAEVKQAQNRAQANVVRTAAAILAWKQQHGAFPDSLQQAMPAVPMDPFDGQPLRYRREGSGFVIYSVGQTGKFDGGTPDKKPDSYETVFHFPMPAYYTAAVSKTSTPRRNKPQ